MKLIPAIDLLDGQVVRLMHGDFNEPTFYPVPAAKQAGIYLDQGADWLHVVDLAASRDGEAADTRPLFKLLGSTDQKVQTGGGVRSGGDVKARLEHGAERVVIGSLCATETSRVCRWLGEYGPDHIVAALDVHIDSGGVPRPRIFGWTEEAEQDLWALLDTLGEAGLRHVLITDIGRDGAMKGPNLELYRSIVKRYPDLLLQASGGVSRLDDLEALADAGADSVIVGKALLEGVFSVSQALERLA